VREPLSIQVHPSKTEAEQGFDAEETAGISLDAQNRNYKDRNHKPEMMIALSEFWALHGFLENAQLQSVLKTIPEFKSFISIFKNNDYKNLYQLVMELPQMQVDAILQPLVARELKRKSTDKSLPGFWVRRLYENKNTKNLTNIDRGIFSIYFFNIVKILPGEAIFQSAGVPHAYLEGQNVELMANSDNVLRGGLTQKHIDVPELLKLTRFEGITPNIIQGEREKPQERIYPCPARDFGISKIELSSSETIENTSFSAEIIFVTEGKITIQNGKYSLNLQRGQAAFIFAQTHYTISTSASCVAFRAFVPKNQLSKS
jgi:mannose-6-phosphate isomerase